MALYFRVELKDDSFIKYVPNELDGIRDIVDYDRYSLILEEKEIVENTNISLSDIKKVYIGFSNRDYYYGLVNNNPYLKGILEDNKSIYKRVVKNKERFYDMEINSIDKSNANYIEMNNYLFNLLNNNNDLLNKVYSKDNTLSNLMNKYIQIKKDISSLEDEYLLKEIKQEIEDELSNYLTYRSLAVSRYNYEKNIKYTEKREAEEEVKPVYKEVEYNDNVDEYGREFDEFFEEDEHFQMTNGDKLSIPYGRR